MQDCWQKSTAAGFIREEMIAAIESVTVRKKDQNILKVPYYFMLKSRKIY